MKSMVLSLAGASLLVGGCTSFIERRAADSTFSIMKGSKTAMQRTSDVELARAATPGGLVQLESFHLAYPQHRGFMGLLTEGYCQYAVGFVYSDWERSVFAGDGESTERNRERTLSLLRRCKDLGMKMLGKTWPQTAETDAMLARLGQAKKRDVTGLSWVALGMANTIALDPFKPKRLDELSLVEAILTRIVELDEEHNDASAHLMLGALASSRPRFLGGDAEAGKRHFQRAKELTEQGSLMIDVVFARTYAVAQKDRTLFRTTLNSVLNSDLSAWPERRLANALAIEKARIYLGAEDALFGPVAAAAPESATPESATPDAAETADSSDLAQGANR